MQGDDPAEVECKLKKPNLYKGIMGVMDLTYKEISERIDSAGLYTGDVSEICRAVRGCEGPKYDKIRRCLVICFADWVAQLDSEGRAEALKPFLKVGALVRFDSRSKLRRTAARRSGNTY